MSLESVFQHIRPGQLAARLDESPQTITNWRSRGIPLDRILDVSKAVDWKVTPHEIRPDIYPNPLDGLPQEKRGRAA